MCKAPQPFFASANDKLDLLYVKSSPVTARLPCHIFTSAPLVPSFKKELDIPNPCQDQTSLMNRVLFEEERVRAMCWFHEASKSSTATIPHCLPRSSPPTRKLAGRGPSQALRCLRMLTSH